MRRGLFGSKMPNPLAATQMVGNAAGAAMSQMPQQRPGLGTRLLGEGWEQRAAALGGALMGDRNAIGRYHAGQQQQDMLRQQQAAELAAEQREIAQGRDDYAWRRQYDIANPSPQAPDAFERALAGAGIDPASPQGQQMYAARAQSMTRDPNDEFVVVPIPGMGTYAGPRSGLGQAMGQGSAPAAPVGQLRPVNTSPRQIQTTGNRATARRITPQELNAIVQSQGPQAAQRMLDAGEIMVEY